MRLTVERAELLRLLQHVQSVVERRNTIPILSNLLLSAEDGALRITATDMDISVVDSGSSTILMDGRTTVPALMLYDIVRKLPDGAQVELAAEDGNEKLALRSGSTSFSLNCLPADDFPAMAEGDFDTRFTIPARNLRRLMEKTRFAISTEETRYYLNGVYFHAVETPGALRTVATDGHRLARVETELPDGAESMPGVIVPRKAVNELHKLLDDIEDEVAVDMAEGRIRFTVGSTVLTTKLVDGTFPDYERVIPARNENIITVHSRNFAAAVDRVSTVSEDKSRSVKLSIDSGKMVLSAHNVNQASASEEVAVDHDGPAIDIGFNARYVLDMTQQIDGESLRFAVSDPAAPAVISDSDDASALYVLMPLRV